MHQPALVDNAGGLSAYGTMGQGGNLTGWLETPDGSGSNPSKRSRGSSAGSFPLAIMGLSNEFAQFK